MKENEYYDLDVFFEWYNIFLYTVAVPFLWLPSNKKKMNEKTFKRQIAMISFNK